MGRVDCEAAAGYLEFSDWYLTLRGGSFLFWHSAEIYYGWFTNPETAYFCAVRQFLWGPLTCEVSKVVPAHPKWTIVSALKFVPWTVGIVFEGVQRKSWRPEGHLTYVVYVQLTFKNSPSIRNAICRMMVMTDRVRCEIALVMSPPTTCLNMLLRFIFSPFLM